MDVLEGLNPAQKEAVGAEGGPILILAGPGSGKTRVITHRIAYLIKTCGISPRRIMAVTFTNKAAKEMEQRLFGKSAEDPAAPLLDWSRRGQVTLGTFHAICARLIRTEGKAIGIDTNYVIYDDDDQISLIKKAMVELNIDPKQITPGSIQNAISAAKSQMLSPDALPKRTRSYFDEAARRVYERYQEMLKSSSALDFDDLLLKVVELFKKNPEVLTKYQNRYIHILVDEFQDTNIVQYELVKLLSAKYRNIFVVGDPDQSIYSWRFADLRNILNFEKDFPDAKVFLLEQNYRSTGMILNTASCVIAKNKQMKPRKLWTENEEGEQITVHEAYTGEEEGQFVVSEVENLTSTGKFKPGDIAVMYRTNAQSRVIEEAFIRYGMPYHLVAGTRFYERREIKDLIAYFRLIQNPNDTVSLARIINVPGRGIGEKTLTQLSGWAKSLGTSEYEALRILSKTLDDSPKKHPFAPQIGKALSNFSKLIDELVPATKDRKMTALFDLVCEKIGYYDYLMKEPTGDERWENVMELRTVAQQYDVLSPSEGLPAFLEGISLVSDVDSLKENSDVVTLITLHQAKGLEFPVVFIVGMEEGLLPHIRSFDDQFQMEEERRLCYVGITRAEKKLYLVHAFRRNFMGMSGVTKPSRFLDDIPKDLVAGSSVWQEGTPVSSVIYQWNRTDSRKEAVADKKMQEFSAGDHVKHSFFGEGTVISYQPLRGDAEVVVAFKGSGVKKLLVSFASLEKVA